MVVFVYLAELALYALYIAHLIARRQMKREIGHINRRLDEINAGNQADNENNQLQDPILEHIPASS